LKNWIAVVCLGLVLAGCAETKFRYARANANGVKNGMSVWQAKELLGTSPTDQTDEILVWRYGRAQDYNATPDGAIVFHVKDGVIADIPAGGIFGPEARRQFVETHAVQPDRERLDAAEPDVESNEQYAAGMAAAAQAANAATIPCDVKLTCAKVFTLAQAFIAAETHQDVRVVSDALMRTGSPTALGQVSASVFRTPQRPGRATVTLRLSCKAGSIPEQERLCRETTTRLYLAFRPYIEERLK
jgi:hypothetical protein